MNITRNNYETFFMLYADNELPAAEMVVVEAFIAANPDLRAALALFQQFKISPDEEMVFTHKETLLKQAVGNEAITLLNYHSFFILYADDELGNNEKAAIENFVYQHPQLQAAFELMQQLRLSPDSSIVFNKASLYRKEEDDRVVPFRWWRLAAAAMLLLLAGVFWIYQLNKNKITEQFVKNALPVTKPQQPTLHNKGLTGATTSSNKQPVIKELAELERDKYNEGVKKAQAVQVITVPVKNESHQYLGNAHTEDQRSFVEEDIAVNTNDRLKGSSIAAIDEPTAGNAAINTNTAVAASKSVKNLQLTYIDTDENNKVKVEWASSANVDKVQVLNTSVNTKNTMRGFFRKASRLIGKKANLDNGDSTRKSILIGGFEIAVR